MSTDSAFNPVVCTFCGDSYVKWAFSLNRRIKAARYLCGECAALIWVTIKNGGEAARSVEESEGSK